MEGVAELCCQTVIKFNNTLLLGLYFPLHSLRVNPNKSYLSNKNSNGIFSLLFHQISLWFSPGKYFVIQLRLL